MLDTRGRFALALGAAALILSGCGGDDEPTSSPTGDASATEGSKPAEEPQPESSCTPDVAAVLPESLTAEACWSVTNATNPVLVGDQVFALVTDPVAAEGSTGSEPTSVLTAYDAASGEMRWSADPLPGDVEALVAADVDGEPGVAALVIENTEGDAVTEASQAIGYVAWPGAVDDDTPTEAAVHITTPPDESGYSGAYWTDQGLLVGGQVLEPGASAFEPVEYGEEIVVGDYDLGETFAGVSGDLLLSYVSDIAWTDNGHEDGDSYVGWVARSAADGTQAWDKITSYANQSENPLGAEGPQRLPVLLGGYALTVVPGDETSTTFTLEWFDAATGDPAEPTSADLADIELNTSPNLQSGGVPALISPDGKYVFVYSGEVALVIDVDAGQATRVQSDFDIAGDVIDETTVYGTTENGNVTIDLATATAAAVPTPRENVDVSSPDYGALMVADPAGTGTDLLVVAARS